MQYYKPPYEGGPDGVFLCDGSQTSICSFIHILKAECVGSILQKIQTETQQVEKQAPC